MRVLIATPYFLPHIGGVENYVFAIATGLQRRGFEVAILTTWDGFDRVIVENMNGLLIHRLPILFKLSNTPVNPFWIVKMKEIIETYNPDLVNAHTPVPFFADLAIEAATELSIPTVVTYHNDVVKENPVLKLVSNLYYSILGIKTLHAATAVIATSSAYADKSQYLIKHKNKVHIVPPGVDPIAIIASEDRYSKPYIIFVGKLDKTHRHKGLPYLIDAFALVHLQLPNVRLCVVGNGADIEMYKKKVAYLNLSSSVEFLTHVRNDQLPALYAGAVCLCLPSISEAEGFGMVVIEAAQQYTPSVGSDVGGIPQSILEGVTGLLFEPKNITTTNKIKTTSPPPKFKNSNVIF